MERPSVSSLTSSLALWPHARSLAAGTAAKRPASASATAAPPSMVAYGAVQLMPAIVCWLLYASMQSWSPGKRGEVSRRQRCQRGRIRVLRSE